jgi:hypothetical protein
MGTNTIGPNTQRLWTIAAEFVGRVIDMVRRDVLKHATKPYSGGPALSFLCSIEYDYLYRKHMQLPAPFSKG